MENLYGITRFNLEKYFISINEKKFKAEQIYDWIYIKRIQNFDDMRNVKKEVINKLKEKYSLEKINIIKKEEDIGVKKYLFELDDKNKVEAVIMFHEYGNSLCISTQVGCNMGCLFCESGKLKCVRNLKTFEMIEQILLVESDINDRISHIVLMGIGEPFDNYDNVMDFIKIVNDKKGIDIGARHITVSTCGIIPKIEKFMNEKMQVNLAISLHAANDELRNRLMPINKVYNLDKLIDIIKKYIKKTNRRVTFEYVMIKDINDSKKHALELVELLKGINCYVNLIPYNETSNSKYSRSETGKILEFYDIMKKNNIQSTIRKEFGNNVTAACGQLRANN